MLMDYEETQWRNGVFLVEHTQWQRDKNIVPLIGLLTRIVTQIIPSELYNIC